MSENIPFPKHPINPRGNGKDSGLSGLKKATLPIPIDTQKLFDVDIKFELLGQDPPVYVAGTFNDWEPRLLMQYTRENIGDKVQYNYFVTVQASIGKHYFRFFLGEFDVGKWYTDPTQTIEADIKNGSRYNVLTASPRSASSSPRLSPLWDGGFDPNRHGSEIVPGAPPGWKHDGRKREIKANQAKEAAFARGNE